MDGQQVDPGKWVFRVREDQEGSSRLIVQLQQKQQGSFAPFGIADLDLGFLCEKCSTDFGLGF